MNIIGLFHAKYLVNKFLGTILPPNIIIAQDVLERKRIFYPIIIIYFVKFGSGDISPPIAEIMNAGVYIFVLS